MGKKRIPALSQAQTKELEDACRNGKSRVIRQRARIILLKNQGHSSKYTSSLKGYPKHEGSINGWVGRYEALGMGGLSNRKGQGRKTILDKEAHQEKAKQIVKSERQRLDYAKSLIEKDLDVRMSKKTLTHFLKTLTGFTSASEKA